MFGSHSHSSTTPIITFQGPGPNHQITAINSTGQEVARFIAAGNRKYFTISRLTSPTTPPLNICTGSRSSWSDDKTLHVHGTELKLKWDQPLYDQAHVKMPGPLGKLEWLEDGGFSSLSKYKLVDHSKRVIARASTKERRCEVLVPGDEVLFDNVLSLWIAYLLYHKEHVLDGSGEGNVTDVGELEATTKILEAVGSIGNAGGN